MTKFLISKPGFILFLISIMVLGCTKDDDSEQYNLIVFPNPCQDIATIMFSIYEPDYITIEVFNMEGKKIETIVDNQNTTQINSKWNCSSLDKGIYLVKLTTSNFTQSVNLVKL